MRLEWSGDVWSPMSIGPASASTTSRQGGLERTGRFASAKHPIPSGIAPPQDQTGLLIGLYDSDGWMPGYGIGRYTPDFSRSTIWIGPLIPRSAH